MEGAAQRLHDTAFHLIPQRIGIDDEAAVVRAHDADHGDAAASRIDGDLHRRGDVILRLLVAHVRDAASFQQTAGRRRAPRRRPRLPPESLRRARDRVDRARVGEPREPERDGVGVRRGRELVGEALDREDVGDLSRRAQVGELQRRLLRPVHEHPGVRHVVRRIAVLRDCAGALPMLLREAGGVGGEQRTRAGRLRRQPHVGRPADDRAALVHARAHVDQLLRPLRIPPRLVLPRPLDSHRLADRLRDQHRVGRDVIAAVGAVRSRAVEKDDTDPRGIEAEHLREIRAQAVSALR